LVAELYGKLKTINRGGLPRVRSIKTYRLLLMFFPPKEKVEVI
jgi:hypothetical protein